MFESTTWGELKRDDRPGGSGTERMQNSEPKRAMRKEKSTGPQTQAGKPQAQTGKGKGYAPAGRYFDTESTREAQPERPAREGQQDPGTLREGKPRAQRKLQLNSFRKK